MQNYGSPELEFERGEGCYLFTYDGKRYLDFTMGIAVNSLGHCHPALVSVLQQQAQTLWHTSNLFRIRNAETLAAALCKASFADRVFFSNSGTEAIECAIKLCRRYFHNKGQSSRKRIICLGEAFHGRTLAALAAAGNAAHCEGYLVGDSGFDHAPFGDIHAMRQLVGEETAGILLEPVQGEGGIRVAADDYLLAIKALCKEKGILLLLDEVQCGAGRTGTLYAHEQLGLTPDILATAKGLGGGFPVGACLATEEVASVFQPGTHGSTFGGNPLAMAVANRVLQELTSDTFLDTVRQRGDTLRATLQQLIDRYPEHLDRVDGLGLMLGLYCKSDAAELGRRLQQAGLLVVKAGQNSIRLLPPLNVTESEIEEAANFLDTVLAAW